MKNNLPAFLQAPTAVSPRKQGGRNVKIPFIEKGIRHLTDVIKTGFIQWENASRAGFFQRLDPRVKIIFLLFWVIIVSLKKNLPSQALIGSLIFSLTLLSRLNIFRFYKRVVLLGFFFGFLVALPSALNVITKGEIIFPIMDLAKGYSFWIYRIPMEIGVTREGAYGVMMLTSRVMNSLAVSFLVLYTTPFPEIIKALKVLKVPDPFLLIVTLSYKYIFIFAKTAEDLHLAKKSRTAGPVSNGEAREWIAGRIFFLFRKTRLRCEEIFKAMLARGFAAEINLPGFKKLNSLDWSAGIGLFLAGFLLFWM